jgi:hypothetical protein
LACDVVRQEKAGALVSNLKPLTCTALGQSVENHDKAVVVLQSFATTRQSLFVRAGRVIYTTFTLMNQQGKSGRKRIRMASGRKRIREEAIYGDRFVTHRFAG